MSVILIFIANPKKWTKFWLFIWYVFKHIIKSMFVINFNLVAGWLASIKAKFKHFRATSNKWDLLSARYLFLVHKCYPVQVKFSAFSFTVSSSGFYTLHSRRTSYIFHKFISALSNTTEVCSILSLFHPLVCWLFIQGGPAVYFIISRLHCQTQQRSAVCFYCFILWFADTSFRENQLCIL